MIEEGTVARIRGCTPFIKLRAPSSFHNMASVPLSVPPEAPRAAEHSTCKRVRATSMGLVASVAVIPAIAPEAACKLWLETSTLTKRERSCSFRRMNP